MTIRYKDIGHQERVNFRARSVIRHPCLFARLWNRWLDAAITDNWSGRAYVNGNFFQEAAKTNRSKLTPIPVSLKDL